MTSLRNLWYTTPVPQLQPYTHQTICWYADENTEKQIKFSFSLATSVQNVVNHKDFAVLSYPLAQSVHSR